MASAVGAVFLYHTFPNIVPCAEHCEHVNVVNFLVYLVYERNRGKGLSKK